MDDRMSAPMDPNMSLDAAVPSKSKYIAKEDVERPVLAQISHMTTDMVEGDHGNEPRAVLHFDGDVKPLILNNTNKETLKAITGAETIGQLKGHQIVLFNDPTVMFGKKRVGGVRLRAPKNQAQPEPQFDEDIPY